MKKNSCVYNMGSCVHKMLAIQVVTSDISFENAAARQLLASISQRGEQITQTN